MNLNRYAALSRLLLNVIFMIALFYIDWQYTSLLLLMSALNTIKLGN